MSMDYEGILVWGISLQRPYSDDDYFDEDFYEDEGEEEWEWEYDRLEDDGNVEVLWLGDHDCCSMVLHPRGAKITGGYAGEEPMDIDQNDLVVQADWEQQLRDYCQKHDVPWSEPKWWLGWRWV